MAIARVPSSLSVVDEVPELHSGDRMTREEFHRVYERMPEDFKAELIGGTVYVASPLKRGHGTVHFPLGTLLFTYQGRTPGVESGDNTTLLLGEDSEPQPDAYLRILPEFGGQSRTTSDDYIEGAPELIAEIAYSSRAIDLHAKRKDYARYGVLEYLVISVKEREMRWFDLKGDRELAIPADGVVRVRAFPGLWIHAQGLLAKDYQRMMETLEEGLASAEHLEFAERLAGRRGRTE
jgi:Uma2 family endonuclease